ncbi:MAG: SGNH/GDSL hydrolase family protein [Acidimicrobiia bacterium]
MSRAIRRGLAGALIGLVSLTLTVACGSDRTLPSPASPIDNEPPFLYVALGGSDSVGVGSDEPLREAWPQVFYRRALPRRATFVNLGVPAATVADAFLDEAQEAVTLGPQLVTVWLNVTEVLLDIPVDVYAADLSNLVRLLRRGGDTEVLVANVPPLDRLPAYLSCREAPRSSSCYISQEVPPPEVIQASVDAYNRAIAEVVEREGAILVDLYNAGIQARRDGADDRLVAEDGFHPSTGGHDAVASVFAGAWKRRNETMSAPTPTRLETPEPSPDSVALSDPIGGRVGPDTRRRAV